MFLAKDLGTGRAPHDDFWYYPVGMPTAAGVRISPQTALAISALYACALVLGQSLGVVPVHLYRRRERGRERAAEHALYRLIHRRPNRWQTSFQWRQMMQWHLALRYNAYSEILYGRRGEVAELVPLHPDRVRVERYTGAGGMPDFRYQVKDAAGTQERTLLRDEMFHVRGLSSDGVEGFSPLDAQSESLGEARAAQDYSSRHLRNDARSPIALEWAGHFKDDDERTKFRASWQASQTGENRGKTPVLERGMTIKEIGVKNTDLQFIELRKLKGYDVASMFRMPPHKIGLMERATFTNIEHQAIEFVTDTMLPWYVNWEQELGEQLLTEREREELYFEFAVDGLLRGDAKTRAEYYGKRFQTGSLSPNDIRGLENEAPVEGGDRYFVPVNMVPIDRADDLVDRGGNKDAAPGGGGAGGQDGQGGGMDDGGNARARAIEQAAAERVVRKEAAQLRRIAERAPDGVAFAEEVERFYLAHADFVEDALAVEAETAERYCLARIEAVRALADQDAVLAFLAALERTGAGELLAAIPREGAYDPIADGLHSIAAAIAGRPAASVDVRAGDTHVHMPEPAVVVNNEVVAQPGRMDLHATLHRAPLRRTVTQRDADGLAAEIVEREIEE